MQLAGTFGHHGSTMNERGAAQANVLLASALLAEAVVTESVCLVVKVAVALEEVAPKSLSTLHPVPPALVLQCICSPDQK